MHPTLHSPRRSPAACAPLVAIVTALLLGLIAAPRAAAQSGCAPSESNHQLQTVLPLELLDYLEQNAASPFVEAFLVAQLTVAGNEEHWLGACARQFIQTPLDSVAVLRGRRLPVDQVLAAFRDAERQRQADERIRGGSLAALVSGLTTTRDAPSWAAALPFLEAAQHGCGTGELCRQLSEASGVIRHALAQQDTLRITETGRDMLATERAAASEAHTRDSLAHAQLTDSLRTLRERISNAQLPADSAVLLALSDTLRGHLQMAAATLNSAREEFLGLDQKLQAAMATVQVARDRAASLTAAVSAAVAKLSTALSDAPASVALSAPVSASSSAIQVSAVVAPPSPLAVSAAAPAARASNVLLELTDFVIARAKQELVLGFLAGVYEFGRSSNGRAVAAAFPSTFTMMENLSTARGSRLSVVAAGQVPLTVWRATIADDYVRLPGHLLTHYCAAPARCHTQFQAVRPALDAMQRVLAGDDIFDIVRAFPDRVPLTSASARADTMLRYGLGMVAALAEGFRIQGIAATADPLRHPYILTSRSLVQSRPAQQQAFVRILLISAIPSGLETLANRPDSLLFRLQEAARSLEALAAPARAAEAGSGARVVVRNATGAVLHAFDVGRAFLAAGEHGGLDALRSRWDTVLAVLPPLAERDYPLFMARTTAMVRSLSGSSPSAPVLQLMGLAANLTSAQNSADVRAAFEAAAAPAGLWQEKRYGQGRRTSITAFPGIAAGGEQIVDGALGATVGGSAQIGVEYQFGRRVSGGPEERGCWGGMFCSAGLFLPVIDLGTLLTYRVSGGDAEAHPNESFRQVFAPGLYLSLGLGHSPLALLGGVQFVPGIRSVTDNNGTREADAFRFGAALAVDLTVFRL